LIDVLDQGNLSTSVSPGLTTRCLLQLTKIPYFNTGIIQI